MSTPLREAMERHAPAVAVWVTTPWPGVVEICGAAGADAVLVDLEHTSFDLPEAEEMVRAADAAGISAIVRTPANEAHTVSRILDAGAHGVIFPKVETAEAAAHCVACCRYPPRGLRGWGGAHTRYNRWTGGYAKDLFGGSGSRGVYSAEYVAEADARALKVMLIETLRGVENADAIIGTEGVDAVIFGWGDYSVETEFDEQACRDGADVVAAACEKHGVALAVSGGAAPPGGFVIAGIDSLILSAGIGAAVARARGAVAA